MKSIFLFRRDLRLEDNLGLIKALNESEELIPVFIFNPEQLNNEYRSEASIQFMIQSLEELDEELKNKGSKLYLFKGKPEDVIENLSKEIDIEKVYANEDYTPFAKKRDELISKKINLDLSFDYLLTRPGEVLKQDNTPYSVYTPFQKFASKIHVKKPVKNIQNNYFKGKIKNTISLNEIKFKKNNFVQKGGRKEGLKLLNRLETLKDYQNMRDFPEKEGISYLSPHHKFGTISIRETYERAQSIFGKDSQFIKELYWRDFYTHIVHFFPQVFGHSFKKQYDSIKWENNEEFFKAWKNGLTGFPIVDAGIRELNKTGFMHNRVRMIVASFLIKDLLIDWRWGEKYFAKKLVDYDPSVNNGSWQWAASTGCDAQPYFRIFNPWLQQKKFDYDCKYIKKWIPELKEVPNNEIHDWEYSNELHDVDYPAPIVNHHIQKVRAIKLFKINI